jgi:HKD family nuclease
MLDMRVEFLGPGASSSAIRSRLLEKSEFTIAVAFLRNDGLEAVKKQLVRGNGKFIVGTSSFYITDWKALSKLFMISSKNPNLRVKRYHSTAYHPKVFLFDKGESADIIIGSSNLTGGGLVSNVEANVLVECNKTDRFFKDVQSFLETLFRGAVPLDLDFITGYRKRSIQFRRTTASAHKHNQLERTPTPDFGVNEEPFFRPGIAKSSVWWKIAPGRNGWAWPRWEASIDSENNGYVALGWPDLGDVHSLLKFENQEFEARIIPLLERTYYSGERRSALYAMRQFWDFGRTVRKGHFIVAYSNKTVFGIGRISGPYHFDSKLDPDFPHTRRVKWISLSKYQPSSGVVRQIATNDTIHLVKENAIIESIRSQMLGHT